MNQSRLVRKNQYFFKHDYTRPHNSATTSAAVDSNVFEVVPHPPYSPDLAPPHFWLFGALKKHLKGKRFTCDDEVQAAMAKWFPEQPEKFYTDGFEKLVQRSQRCIERERDYVET
jgi:histone-lysine N-methyltransferase SETMAR